MSFFRNARVCLAAIALAIAAIASSAASALDGRPDEYYTLERIPDPQTSLLLEVGGMNFDDDGTLYLGTRRGEVWTLKDGEWNRFASGLAECLGVLPVEPGVVMVTQRTEVTKLIDANADGVADRYENFADDFAFGGNYHEFNFGLVRDAAGNFYGALNLQHTDHDPWGGRFMGADIQDRGTVYRLTPDGEYRTFAWGVRSPNGMTFSPDGDLIFAESQGEFVATNCLYHVVQDGFYGHPASLSFKPGFDGGPHITTIEQLDAMRSPPIVYLPYDRMGKSVTEPRFDITGGGFGPFAGQIFCGDTNSPIITRIFLEKVAGEYQGACFPFMTHRDLEGSNRVAFGPDNALYVGMTNRGWASGTYGVRRIAWTGKVPLEIQKMELQPDGFLVTFTRPVDPALASDPANYQMLHYRYAYHHLYGSDELDKTPIQVVRADVAPDGLSVKLVFSDLQPRRVYQLDIQNVTTPDGTPLRNHIGWYTLNRLTDAAGAR